MAVTRTHRRNGPAAAALRFTREGFTSRAAFAIDAVLMSYAHILFSRSRRVGALLLLATMASPRIFAVGLLSVLVAVGVASVLNLSGEQIRSGAFSYNALLVGLGCGALLEPSQITALLVLVAVSGSVVLTAALRSAMSATFALPVLSLPFLVLLYLVLEAASPLGISWRSGTVVDEPFLAFLPIQFQLYLESLGAIFFSPSVLSGLFIVIALLLHSRIAFLLSFMGFAVAVAIAQRTVGISDPGFATVLGFNGVLVAVALGGVWFVPSLSATILGFASVVGASLLGVALLPLSTRLGLPILIVPFNLTVIAMLYAMRQRAADSGPKSVDFAIGTPEENLTFYRTRIARFGARYLIRFKAPFLGQWVCTQGVDGELTHRGPWKHALDFEVRGEDGQLFSGDGQSLTDYHCYNLPVAASAYGTVAMVVDGVPDNPVGEQDLDQNWGNLVILCHAPGLYSLVCHLAPGSIKVKEGEYVPAGSVLGHCGNSGRSPFPHLHFQLQGSAHIGAPTLPIELNDVVCGVGHAAEVLETSTVPIVGSLVRNLVPQSDLAGLVAFQQGQPFFLSTAGEENAERIEPDIDAFGRRVLVSPSRRATLYYDHTPERFCVFDTVGSRRSHLHFVQMALGRLPFEGADSLQWTDYLPTRRLLPKIVAPIFDLFSPFLPGLGLEVVYRAEREGNGLIVRGESLARGRDGRPRLTTLARLQKGRGIDHIRIRLGKREQVISRARSAKSQATLITNNVRLAAMRGTS